MTDAWPEVSQDGWVDTCTTLQLWTQVVGKVRLALAPLVNHWWQVPLYVSVRGLTTSPIPYGTGMFEMEFDFREHELRIETSAGQRRRVELKPRSVADFYAATMDALHDLDIDVSIWPVPVELPDPTPFAEDHEHASYDSAVAQSLWRILLQSERVFTQFRSRFIGKVSPVHFFWGSFDLALTRFSGRRAPQHPGVPIMPDFITHEAYSHEVSSCGFFPGSADVPPAFYAYAYPTPDGFADAPVQPDAAFFSQEMGEFLLPYEAVRAAPAPDEALMAFLQSTYVAAADLAQWDRAALER